jgi:hypothetical protein
MDGWCIAWEIGKGIVWLTIFTAWAVTAISVGFFWLLWQLLRLLWDAGVEFRASRRCATPR